MCEVEFFWEVCFKEGTPNEFYVVSEGPLLHCQIGYLEDFRWIVKVRLTKLCRFYAPVLACSRSNDITINTSILK